jgi:hypothetical protein
MEKKKKFIIFYFWFILLYISELNFIFFLFIYKEKFKNKKFKQKMD